jgi:hypothetical protein
MRKRWVVLAALSVAAAAVVAVIFFYVVITNEMTDRVEASFRIENRTDQVLLIKWA